MSTNSQISNSTKNTQFTQMMGLVNDGTIKYVALKDLIIPLKNGTKISIKKGDILMGNTPPLGGEPKIDYFGTELKMGSDIQLVEETMNSKPVNATPEIKSKNYLPWIILGAVVLVLVLKN